jgi:hypothetical protein
MAQLGTGIVGGSVVDGMAQLGSWRLSSGWDGSIG